MHAGLHKTGTTSIQHTLFSDENQKILQKEGLLYPKLWPNNHSIPLFSIFSSNPEKYHINIRKGLDSEQVKLLNKRYLSSLDGEIKGRNNYTQLIFSGEDISLLQKENLVELKKFLIGRFGLGVKIRVIIYVREPVSWATSFILQMIKGGECYSTSLKAVKNIIPNLFYSRINKFIEVFDKNSVEIYRMEAAMENHQSIVNHFLQVVGLNEKTIKKFNLVDANKSCSLIAAHILSYFNEKKRMIIDGKKNKERSNNDFVPILNINGSSFNIPSEEKKIIEELSRSDSLWLEQYAGIDYSQRKDVSGEKNYCYNRSSANDIKAAYNQLSFPLRKLVISFLEREFQKDFEEESKKVLENLLKELKIVY